MWLLEFFKLLYIFCISFLPVIVDTGVQVRYADPSSHAYLWIRFGTDLRSMRRISDGRKSGAELLSLWLPSALQNHVHYLRSLTIKVIGFVGILMTRSPFDHRHTYKKHCQRHNGPEDWVHLDKVASRSHIRSSNINLDHISPSKSQISINKKSQPNISISTKLKIQNLDQT